jgi:hypothetical protein
MSDKKIVSIDLDAVKQKAADAAKFLGNKAKSSTEKAAAMAKSKTDQAAALLLDKGIKLSQKQLKALETKRERLG